MAEQVRHDAWHNGDNMTSKKTSGLPDAFLNILGRGEDYFFAVL